MQRLADIIVGAIFMMAIFVILLVYPAKPPKHPPDTK